MLPLSETQLMLLRAATQRPDGNVLPLPGSLRGTAAIKVVRSLLARGLASEVVTDNRTNADAALNRVWRNEANGGAVLLLITEAGRAAVGMQTAHGAPVRATEALPPRRASDHATAEERAHTARPWRENTKQALLIAMLMSERGATLAEIVIATGWQAHTVRGALAGALKKRLGLVVVAEMVEGERRYRISGSGR